MSKTYPLAMPDDLLNELREVARETDLSIADAMRQSMRMGLPVLRQSLRRQKPMTPDQANRAFAPDPQWEAFEEAMCRSTVAPEP